MGVSFVPTLLNYVSNVGAIKKELLDFLAVGLDLGSDFRRVAEWIEAHGLSSEDDTQTAEEIISAQDATSSEDLFRNHLETVSPTSQLFRTIKASALIDCFFMKENTIASKGANVEEKIIDISRIRWHQSLQSELNRWMTLRQNNLSLSAILEEAAKL